MLDTMRLNGRTDEQGVLRLTLPVGVKETEYEVVVVMQPKEPKGERVWPPGFFEQVVGKWEGEFERPPQGEINDREVP